MIITITIIYLSTHSLPTVLSTLYGLPPLILRVIEAGDHSCAHFTDEKLRLREGK